MVDVSTQQRGAVGLASAGPLQAATTKAPGRKRGLFFWLPLAWLAVLAFAAIFAPWLGLHDPDEIDFINPQSTPNAEHWFGTDVLGRDVLARTIFGARVSLIVGFCAPGLGMICGLILGMLAGYYRGRLETVVVASIDTLLAVPGLVARAKGLPPWRIILLHALRPSSFSMITILGLQVGGLIGGAIIIETIFALTGVGRLLINAILARDFIVVQGIVTFVAIIYVVVNFGVDLFYAVLDPRIRTERAHG